MKLIRYADDFVVLVHGPRGDAEALFGEVAAVIAPMGLRLSEEKTHVTHIDDGFDFLGWRIQRRTWKGRGGLNTHTVARRHLPGWQIKADGIEFFRAWQVPVTRYRYRGTKIPNPGVTRTSIPAA